MLTMEMIQQAQERIAPYMFKTPLIHLNNLDEYLGCQVYVKMEPMQKTNSFKVRGAVNRMLTIKKEAIKNGVITASSGNHGKATAFAAKQLGVKATVVVPDNTPKIKVEGIISFGAEIIFSVPSERITLAQKLSSENDWCYIPPYDDYEIMAGQGTAGLEIMEQLPDADYIIVPIGGGGLISGISTAAKGTNPNIKIIGVEPALVARYTESFAAGHPVTLSPDSNSVADGLQSLRPGERNYPIVQKNVDKIVTVDEEYILKATKLLLTQGKILAEISSCTTLGAVLQGQISFKPEEKVVFFLSGGNIGMDQFSKFDKISI